MYTMYKLTVLPLSPRQGRHTTPSCTAKSPFSRGPEQRNHRLHAAVEQPLRKGQLPLLQASDLFLDDSQAERRDA